MTYQRQRKKGTKVEKKAGRKEGHGKGDEIEGSNKDL